MSTSYGTFTATYRATSPSTATTTPGLNNGTPFDGTLTVTNGSTTWTLAKPDSPYMSQINEMCVIAFQPEVDPGVMIEGFTGGAHCCETPVIYLFNHAENRYVKVVDMSPIDFRILTPSTATEDSSPRSSATRCCCRPVTTRSATSSVVTRVA